MNATRIKFWKKMGPWTAAGLLMLAASPLAAAAESTGPEPLAKLIEGAKKEGKLVVYHSPVVPDIKKMLDRFSQKYPFIRGEQYRASSVSLANRIFTEARAKVNKWDVVINNAYFMHEKGKKDILQKYLSDERKAFGTGYRDEEGYWTGLFLNTSVIAYNTRLVARKDIPKTFTDLLDAKWKGKIAMESEPYQFILGLEKDWGAEKAWDYLKKLAKQKVILRQGRTMLTQLCAAGDFPLTFPIYGYDIERKKKDGAALDWVGAEPVILSQEGIGVAKTPVHTNAAKLFTEFALSKEGQSVVREFGRIPARLEIKPDPPRLTEGLRLVPSDPTRGGEVQRVLKDFNALFKS